MANGNPFIVNIEDISADGTNYFVYYTVFNGSSTSARMMSVFTFQATAANILAHCQTVANNQISLPASVGALVGTKVIGQ